MYRLTDRCSAKLVSAEVPDLEIRLAIYLMPTTGGILIEYQDILVP